MSGEALGRPGLWTATTLLAGVCAVLGLLAGGFTLSLAKDCSGGWIDFLCGDKGALWGAAGGFGAAAFCLVVALASGNPTPAAGALRFWFSVSSLAVLGGGLLAWELTTASSGGESYGILLLLPFVALPFLARAASRPVPP